MADAIHTEQVTKRYGKRRGLDGLDLTVRLGEVFGFLGPNGAGLPACAASTLAHTCIKLPLGIWRFLV